MAVLEIRRAGDPVLKKVSEPVKRIDKKVKRILKDMADTLYKSGNGIGLAAPEKRGFPDRWGRLSFGPQF